MTTGQRDRVLITGGGGFVGSWLARALCQQGTAVTVADLAPSPKPLNGWADQSSWLPLDVRRPADIRAVLAEVRPTAIYHLAGLSFPPAADDAAAQTFEVNVGGAVNLLAAVASTRRKGGEDSDPVVLVVGSATQYGHHDAADLPLTEEAEQRPVSVYGASKAAQEIVARQVFRADGVRVICTRSFNHTGVGHGDQYLLPSLVQRGLALKASGAPTLEIGNDSIRDFLHVADAVDAYVALVRDGRPGDVYNVCSGTGHRVSTLARDVLLRLGVTAAICSTSTLLRAKDTDALVGSPAKLIAATQWAPRYTLLDIIDDLIHAATH